MPRLVIGNKKDSSWSLRPWIAMRQAGIDFEAVLIPPEKPNTKARIAEYSPAGKVAVLAQDEVDEPEIAPA